MSIRLIFVDDHQGVKSIRAVDGIGGDERVSASVFEIAGCGIKFVRSSAVLYPLQIDQTARMVLRGERLHIQICISDVVAVGAEAMASRAQVFRLYRGVIVDGTARCEK